MDSIANSARLARLAAEKKSRLRRMQVGRGTDREECCWLELSVWWRLLLLMVRFVVADVVEVVAKVEEDVELEKGLPSAQHPRATMGVIGGD